uniref:Calcitonin gene-related peptide type 1 receptor n=1 Tax=Knipowitschia caucasica TaxID=637954 RepID=A0AAV2KRQ6_KNICA
MRPRPHMLPLLLWALAVSTGGSSLKPKQNSCLLDLSWPPPQTPTLNSTAALFCPRAWDGGVCWPQTPAGTSVTLDCPGRLSTDLLDVPRRWCDERGQWADISSPCVSQDPLELPAPMDPPEPLDPLVQTQGASEVMEVSTDDSSTEEDVLLKKHLIESQRRCQDKMAEDLPQGAGRYCSAEWDGFLCWEPTPAGAVFFQKCPVSDWSGEPTETVSRFCSEEGQWQSTNSSGANSSVCATNPRTAAQLYVDIDDTQASLAPSAQSEEEILVRRKILDNQYKCFEKMYREPALNSSDVHCGRNWDGWLCWDDTPAGTLTSQNCPNYFKDFDPTEKATKLCGDDGQWFRHPETNRTWSNYTRCNEKTVAKLRSAYILFYMAIVGHALSIASLLISLAIFFYFRSLSCQRITLHKNLFCSYVLNSALTILYLVAVVNNPAVVMRNPMGCKVLHFFHMYMLGCNYFWMLCEGIYLHTLIVVAVFAEEQHLHWYYLLGWGFPLVPASIHAVARKTYFDDKCWMSVETHLLYAVHGPIVAALLVNLFFLLNIIRVLVTKLRTTHRAESNMYMKAVRATLILVPLLGIQFVIFPWRPENRVAGEVYEYIMHILMHYQGLLVATIFCFFNGEVQAALKRQWVQYKMQWGQRRREHCSMRSTSYTATSMTEVPAFMFQDAHEGNGRHADHAELLTIKLADTYA